MMSPWRVDTILNKGVGEVNEKAIGNGVSLKDEAVKKLEMRQLLFSS